MRYPFHMTSGRGIARLHCSGQCEYDRLCIFHHIACSLLAQQCPHSRMQLRSIHWFRDKLVGSDLDAALLMFSAVPRGQEDHGGQTGAALLLDATAHVEAIEM